MWSVSVVDMLGRPVEIGWDSDKRCAFVAVELPPDAAHCAGCQPADRTSYPHCEGIRQVRIPIAAEVFRSLARVIAGWPL